MTHDDQAYEPTQYYRNNSKGMKVIEPHKILTKVLPISTKEEQPFLCGLTGYINLQNGIKIS